MLLSFGNSMGFITDLGVLEDDEKGLEVFRLNCPVVFSSVGFESQKRSVLSVSSLSIVSILYIGK